MIRTCDVGSLPLRSNPDKFREGARSSQTILPALGIGGDSYRAFEEEVVGGFIDKMKAGIDTPNYPQLRDMNEMFFELFRGVERTGGQYAATSKIEARPSSAIPEVSILKRNLSRIRDATGSSRVPVKACITGPYTLSAFFPMRDPGLIEQLGGELAKITANSLFKARGGEVRMLCIDEPTLGFLNDPLLDYGSRGRDSLRGAWEEICSAASSRGVETSIHLHDTSDDLFWEVEHLDMIESHVGDPLYELEKTKRKLEETDKALKASVAITLFDNLISNQLVSQGLSGEISQQVGDVWTDIRHGRADPRDFMESPELLEKRLSVIVARFGEERVPYACPECGLGGWPDYETAIECLRRVSEVVKEFNRG